MTAAILKVPDDATPISKVSPHEEAWKAGEESFE